MDELYEYLKWKLDVMRKDGSNKVVIDSEHALRLFHTVCYMKQIRMIVEFQDDVCAGGKRGRKKEDDLSGV